MKQIDHYTYRVTWSHDDNEYVGLCAEFPSLSFLHIKQTKALDGIIQLVKNIVDDMITSSEKIPDPIADRCYSGKFVVRTTPERHRLLAIRAAEAGVSLNRYINSKL